MLEPQVTLITLEFGLTNLILGQPGAPAQSQDAGPGAPGKIKHVEMLSNH